MVESRTTANCTKLAGPLIISFKERKKNKKHIAAAMDHADNIDRLAFCVTDMLVVIGWN